MDIQKFIDILSYGERISVEVRITYSKQGYKLYVDFKDNNIRFNTNKHKANFGCCVDNFLDYLQKLIDNNQSNIDFNKNNRIKTPNVNKECFREQYIKAYQRICRTSGEAERILKKLMSYNKS